MAPIFLDTNVFLYAMGAEHAEKAPCRKLLELVSWGKVEAVTSAEVLQEVLFFRMRRGNRDDALESVRRIREMVDDVLPVTGDDVLAACDFLARYPALDARDAVHAAVARRNRITSIVSLDKDFDHIQGLRRLTPAQASA
jgi:uncharacterized protein